ncbi:MAG: enoyl-CoA hydratase/isomerase family protein [Sandarakinorhabdus sp.]|nr:enoyl-CoA hydratase/isomerase family protein [Sandarakinorhabdus sp.]
MSEEPHLLSETCDAILVVTLNRPDKLNALSADTMRLFEAALHRFRDSPELKVMLVRAKGRYFCAGADLKGDNRDGSGQARTASGIRENHRLKLNGMHRIYDEMEHVEKPIVAAIHATCMGGGLELVMSCDFRLAAASARFAFPEGRFGVLPASNGVSRLTRLCGPAWARWLIMANRPVNAERALVMGLVQDVIPDDRFEEEAMAFAQHLAQQNGEQMGAAKIAIELAHEVGPDMARHVERMANSALMLNPAYQEGLAQYIKDIGARD